MHRQPPPLIVIATAVAVGAVKFAYAVPSTHSGQHETLALTPSVDDDPRSHAGGVGVRNHADVHHGVLPRAMNNHDADLRELATPRFVAEDEAVWISKPNKKSEEYKFAVNCDTPDQCKMKVAENKIQCCKLCLDDTALYGHDPSYGFYEFIEKDPWSPQRERANDLGQKGKGQGAGGGSATAINNPNLDKPTLPVDSPYADPSVARTPYDNPTLKAAKKIATKYPYTGPVECPKPEDDDFRLPCCQFCPRSAMSDSGLPFLIGNRFSRNPTLPSVPCCAATASCCRWCPEYVCPYLQEYTFQSRLWWQLCSSWNQDAFPADWSTNTIGSCRDVSCPLFFNIYCACVRCLPHFHNTNLCSWNRYVWRPFAAQKLRDQRRVQQIVTETMVIT